MATQEEQQQLIETLKFTPRTYKISMWGYGGEKNNINIFATMDSYQKPVSINVSREQPEISGYQ